MKTNRLILALCILLFIGTAIIFNTKIKKANNYKNHIKDLINCMNAENSYTEISLMKLHNGKEIVLKSINKHDKEYNSIMDFVVNINKFKPLTIEKYPENYNYIVFITSENNAIINQLKIFINLDSQNIYLPKYQKYLSPNKTEVNSIRQIMEYLKYD